MEWVIYRHISPSGKCYVGQTNRPLESRWNNGKGYSRAFKFGKAIDRYGWENFTHEILESHILTQELANERECFYIGLYDSFINGYNSTKGGDNCEHLGNEIYQINLKKQIVNKFSSAADAERKCGVLAQNIGACLLGHQITAGGYYWVSAEEDIANWNPPQSRKERRVICVETKIVYGSITEAGLRTGLLTSSIGKCVAREAITAGGVHWCYLDEFDETWEPVTSKQLGGPRVAVICVETEEIFESITECSLITGISTQNLCQNCCKAHRSRSGRHYAYLNEYDEFWEPAEKYDTIRRRKSNTLKKKVFCYETQKFYESACETGRCLNLDSRLVSRCCKGELIQTKGYHFCYESDYHVGWHPRKSKQGQKAKPPILCVETKEIFETAVEASKAKGINASSLSQCLNKKCEMAGNYHWSYMLD